MTLTPELLATREAILADGVFLCVRLSSDEQLVESCRAAVRGGLSVLEITLTTPSALEAIAEMTKDDSAIVGAGTVLTQEQVRDVAAAGARFAMSPVLDESLVAAIHAHGMVAVPGIGSATEALRAHRAGASLVKVFPAQALGGPDFLSAVAGPLPEISLVPTSGPKIRNFDKYVAAGAVAVGVGREVFEPDFTPVSVEAAARRVRTAWDHARKAHG